MRAFVLQNDGAGKEQSLGLSVGALKAKSLGVAFFYSGVTDEILSIIRSFPV